jgi:hypothetical protein
MQESQPVCRHLHKTFTRPSQSLATTSPPLISRPPLGGNDDLLMRKRSAITRHRQTLCHHRKLIG